MGTDGEQNAPLHITDAAREKIIGFMAARNKPDGALRVAIDGRTAQGFRYAMGVVDRSDRTDEDRVFDGGGFLIYMDPVSVENMTGATVDYVDDVAAGGIKIENPNPVWRDPVAIQVQGVLDEKINPGVASHGGYVELLGVQDGTAYVLLGGGCQGCGLADVTLKQGIEVIIKEAVPAITAVVDQTDHASGTNPYYQPAKA
jgi:Fe/S biogenesis protein NfuA